MTSTNLLRSTTRDPAAVGQVAGLVLALVGLVTQILSGVSGFPPVPPGPIILVVAAAFVALAPWRWAPVVGLAAALFLAVGFVASFASSGTADRLGNRGAFGPSVGVVLLVLGLVVALVAGAVAAVRGWRRA